VLDENVQMNSIQFYSLRRPMQDRFIESTRGAGAPKPLLFQAPQQSPWVLRLNVLGAVIVGCCAVLACWGFGSLANRFAIQPPKVIFVYAGLMCVGLLALVAAGRIRGRDSGLPFRTGTYLFPSGVVDARTAELKVHRGADLVDAQVVNACMTMKFSDGSSFEFQPVAAARVDELRNILKQAQERLSVPLTEASLRDQALLDPLVDTGFKSLFASAEPIRPPVAKKSLIWLWVTLASGAVAGFGIWYLHNTLSEKQLYIKARRLNTPEAYHSYLTRGGKRSDIRDLLLPRAELYRARALGTPDAIEKFMDAHPHSKIEGEAATALQVALLNDLERARAKETVAALREFRKDDPHAKIVESDRRVALRKLFDAALARFQNESLGTAEQQDAFNRLVRFSEQHEARVAIRFRGVFPESVAKAENKLQNSAFFAGPKALPTQYFRGERSRPREARIAEALAKRFGTLFSSDILDFQLGEPLTSSGKGDETPKVDVPTLLITQTIGLSIPFTCRRPPGAYVGVSFTFKSQLLIPGQPPSLDFNNSVWKTPDFKKLHDEGWGPTELYTFMADSAYDQFLKKYLASLFRSAEPASAPGG
jgi:hypothetical protein